MNMTVSVGPEGFTEVPDVSDDDPARRKFLEEICNLHKKAVGSILGINQSNDNIGMNFYLEYRVRLIKYLGFLLSDLRISEERYRELASEKNDYILYSSDFLDNRDCQDSNGKSISDYLSEHSTW